MFHMLAEHSSDMIVLCKGRTILYANPRVTEALGYSRDELSSGSMSVLDLIPSAERELAHAGGNHPADVDHLHSTLLTRRGDGIAVLSTTRIVSVDGECAVLCIMSPRNRVDPATNVRAAQGVPAEHNGFDRGAPASMLGAILHADPAMCALVARIRTVAPTTVSVLVEGETGTGKELVARAVHEESVRRDKAFIKVDCGALPRTLLESILFGHVKGAFSGALCDRVGLFERANGGTILFDEVQNLPLDLQSKLLRFTEDGSYERVGESRTQQSNVRMLTATNEDLDRLVRTGAFRRDLYYRLRVVRLRIPPLRERGGDVPMLAREFCKRYAAQHDLGRKRFSRAALRRLVEYDWPGNVRELQNVIEHAVILTPGELIEPQNLRELTELGMAGPDGTQSLHQGLKLREKELIAKALKDANGNKKQAAQRLGITRSTLYSRLREHRLI
jgi:PAS domain S-box-containing protein